MAPAPSSQQPTPQRPTAQASKADNTYDDEMPSANELLEIAKKSLQTGAVTGKTVSQPVYYRYSIINFDEAELV